MLPVTSSMKSLILSPKNLSIFTPNLVKTKSLLHPQKTLFSKPLCFYSKPFKNPNYLISQKPIKTHYKRSLIHTEAYSNRDSGEIHVIVGPMFAGKTTTLLHRILSEKTSGRSVAIIKSNKDTRYGLDSIVTHDGDKFPCWPLADLFSFRQKCGADAYEKLDVIGIDEAQFFDDLYDFCRKAAESDGKTVIVAGLDGDYLRRKFGSILDIVPLADSITKLSARCELCGKPAFFTLRRTEERQTELIGGADMYMPVCRKHYVDGHVINSATRIVHEYQKVQTV